MALVSVEGQITTINHQARTLAMKDREGKIHMVRWGQGHDPKMQKQQQWWFCKVTGELADDVITLDVLDFFKKPEDWPGGNHQKGGNYAPQDPRKQQYIIRQSSIERAVTLVLTTSGVNRPLDITLEDVLSVAEKIEAWVMR